MTFTLFGPVHLSILAIIFALGAALTFVQKRLQPSRLRIGVACTLVAVAAVWYVVLALKGWLSFPESLPLELCDFTLAVTILALFTLRPILCELSYYGALGGTSMALLTPDLWEEFPSFSTVYFFVSHGFVWAAALYMAWSGLARPRPGSVWKVWLLLASWAAAVGLFNLAFRTNYMYLCSKPEDPSLLDWFGPWPIYLFTAAAFAVVVFTGLYFPFWIKRTAAASA